MAKHPVLPQGRLTMTVHVLDFNRIEVYEAGAILITLLPYPGASEEQSREAVHASLCHLALRVACALDPSKSGRGSRAT